MLVHTDSGAVAAAGPGRGRRGQRRHAGGTRRGRAVICGRARGQPAPRRRRTSTTRPTRRRPCWSSRPSPAATAGSSRRTTTATSASADTSTKGPRLRGHLAELCVAHGVAVEDLEHLRGHRLPIRRAGAPVATARALLVGDAAGLVDPFSGDGMYEAFLSSKIAAETIADLLSGQAADLSAYPARLGAALEPHVASAWVAKAVIERAPGLMLGILRLPGASRAVAGRMRAHSGEHSAVTRRVARRVGRSARRCARGASRLTGGVDRCPRVARVAADYAVDGGPRRTSTTGRRTMQTPTPYPLVLVTGPTGYVGGRLLAALETNGVHVRCLARRPEALRGRVGAFTEIAEGDIRDPERVAAAMAGVDVAYYLVHSMGSTGAFADEDREAAKVFADAARAAGVARIVYLGGLGSGSELSDHLASRQEVGRVLAASGVPTVEFRAGIVIGSGSLAFDAMRALVRQLPVMIVPRWVGTLTQPIAIDDVVDYLVAAAEHGPAGRRRLRDRRARPAVVRRADDRIRPPARLAPDDHPRSGALALAVEPVARPGDTGLRPRCPQDDRRPAQRDHRARRPGAPRTSPRSPRAASAARSPRPRSSATTPRRAGRMRSRRPVTGPSASPPRASCSPMSACGGCRPRPSGRSRPSCASADAPGGTTATASGSCAAGWTRRSAGVGIRRGRRHPSELAAGGHDRLLAGGVHRARAPAAPAGRDEAARHRVAGVRRRRRAAVGSEIRQTAFFAPSGIWGRAYWYAVAPFHRVLFPRMLEQIAAAIPRTPTARSARGR